MKEFYQIRLWCSDDSCEEFWFYKDLSPVYSDIEEAEKFLSQYEGKTNSEIEKMCDVLSVRSNRPQIHIIEVCTKIKSFSEFCKDYLFKQLDEQEGRIMYACDMAYILCEWANCDGTMTYSRAEAIKYLYEWWYDAADYLDYETDNFGKCSNPFANPEAFMVRMVICGIGYLLSRCEVVDESWNDELELTPEVIKAIKEQCPDEVEW